MSQAPYEIIKIDDTSYRIEENGVRSLLFIGASEALLIDSGFGTGDLRSVVESLTDLPIKLVNTHADRDHIGCNTQFACAYMHPAEYDRYRGAAAEMPTDVMPLWEGDIIDLGNRRFEVILIPGHTPGSIALLDEANGILISGDSVQDGRIFMFGGGRNMPAYLASMKKLSALRGRFNTVYPSHSTFPVSPEIIDGLITGAEKTLSGELKGEVTTLRDAPIRVIDIGVAHFLYNV